jgi:hypothetical protein
MKPCTCGHAKRWHKGWGTKHPGKCAVGGCPCTHYEAKP